MVLHHIRAHCSIFTSPRYQEPKKTEKLKEENDKLVKIEAAGKSFKTLIDNTVLSIKWVLLQRAKNGAQAVMAADIQVHALKLRGLTAEFSGKAAPILREFNAFYENTAASMTDRMDKLNAEADKMDELKDDLKKESKKIIALLKDKRITKDEVNYDIEATGPPISEIALALMTRGGLYAVTK